MLPRSKAVTARRASTPACCASRPISVKRWSYTPQMYEEMLKDAGFAEVEAQVICAPDPEDLGTLAVRAWTAAA